MDGVVDNPVGYIYEYPGAQEVERIATAQPHAYHVFVSANEVGSSVARNAAIVPLTSIEQTIEKIKGAFGVLTRVNKQSVQTADLLQQVPAVLKREGIKSVADLAARLELQPVARGSARIAYKTVGPTELESQAIKALEAKEFVQVPDNTQSFVVCVDPDDLFLSQLSTLTGRWLLLVSPEVFLRVRERVEALSNKQIVLCVTAFNWESQVNAICDGLDYLNYKPRLFVSSNLTLSTLIDQLTVAISS